MPRRHFFISLLLLLGPVESRAAEEIPWGTPEDGGRTRLVPLYSVYLENRPMPFRLEYENLRSESVEFREDDSSQSGFVVVGPDGSKLTTTDVPFMGQIADSSRDFAAKAVFPILETYNLADHFGILRRGDYTIQHKGKAKRFPTDTGYPESNVLSFKVLPNPYSIEEADSSKWGEADANGIRVRLSPAKPKLEIGEPIELKLEVSNTADKPVLCKPEGNRLEAIQVSPPWRREESNPGSEPAKARQWFHCNFRLDAKPILLPPGTAISLTESYPLSKYYFFAQEGTYYFQFVGQDSSIGESPLPPSNICAIELTNPLFTVVKPSAYSSKLDEPILASVLASSQSTHDVAISNSFGFDRMQVLEVLGPDGDPLDRIEQFSGDAADDPPALKSGETRSLFGEINLAKHFIFLDSGNYKLRFKGGEGGRGFRKPEQRMGPGGMSVESECMPQAGVEITDYVPIPPAADADLLIASGTPLPLSQLLGLIRDRLGERYRLRFFANGENEPPTPMIRAGKDDDGVRIEAQTRDPSRVVTKSQTVVRIWLLADSADGAAVSAAEADSKRQSVDRSDEAIQFLGKFRGRFAYVQYYPGADYVCPEIRALLPTLVAQSSN